MVAVQWLLPLQPQSPEQLAQALAEAASRRQTITLGGRFTKGRMGGPPAPSDVTITTAGLNRILRYEPSDLTLSVEAGIPFAEVSRVLAQNEQMIPLDPPHADTATIGGILGVNASGPRRRLYGTARDFVIGMSFATLEGKLVQTGGMVVKNVAGLDMGKLMIGSFGTLAAIATVNFKLFPKPPVERTALFSFDAVAPAIAVRDRILQSVLQPEAIDILNPLAAAQEGQRGWVLAVQFGGSAVVAERYRRELTKLASATILAESESARFWRTAQSFTQRFAEKFEDGAVVRVSSKLSELASVLGSLDVPTLARAASGVSYACFSRADAAAKWLASTRQQPWRAVIESASDSARSRLDLWPAPGSDFAIMKGIKDLFDPNHLLNHGRLYRLL